jgi:hypothetical protein
MYDMLIQTAYPGLLVILIDQSTSMGEPYGAGRKMDFAALAVNRCIYEIIESCKSGDETKNRCQIGVYGYGLNGAELLIGGWVSEIETRALRVQTIPRKVPDHAGGLVDAPLQLPIYIEPKANGSTPMDKAFDEARNLIETTWLSRYPDSFPPIVINITDGAPDDVTQATQAAQRLTALGSNNGKLLLFNAHISDSNAAELSLPSFLPSWGEQDATARFLYQISSEIPQEMFPRAVQAGLNPSPGAKGCLYRAGAELLTKLIVFGSNPMR